MSNQTLACTYAALILQGTGKSDDATLRAVCKAAGVEVNAQLAKQFAGFIKKTDFNDVLKNVAAGGAGATAAAAAAAPAAAAGGKAAAKVEEPEEEEDDFGMGGLF